MAVEHVRYALGRETVTPRIMRPTIFAERSAAEGIQRGHMALHHRRLAVGVADELSSDATAHRR